MVHDYDFESSCKIRGLYWNGRGRATRGHSFMVLCRVLEVQSLHFKGGFPEWKQDIGW